ncbi:MAG TPA: hypothetical protein VFI12_05040 [Thermomicrobiales bacterium]|nr:hypothetical protein [Thermomicrobiales bacterium]
MSVRPFPAWRDAPKGDEDLTAALCRIADCTNRPAYFVRDREYVDVVCGQHIAPFLAEVLGTMGLSVCVEMIWRTEKVADATSGSEPVKL